jgi:hypothetical protein
VFSGLDSYCDNDGRRYRLFRSESVPFQRSDPLADCRRHFFDCGDRHRHDDHGRQFSRARAEQQPARAGKHGVVGRAPFRPAARGFLRHPERCRGTNPVRPNDVPNIRGPAGYPGMARDVEGQDRLLFRSRRHQRLRRQRHADQFLGFLAGARRQYRRSRLLPRLQIRNGGCSDHDRNGADPDLGPGLGDHRCSQTDGTRGRVHRRRVAGRLHRRISKNISPRWCWEKARRFRCICATERFWRAIRTSNE